MKQTGILKLIKTSAAAAAAALLVPSAALAGALEDQVEKSEAIVSGEVVKKRVTKVAPGLYRTTCYVKLHSVFKGEPRFTAVLLPVAGPDLAQRVAQQVVAFSFDSAKPGGEGALHADRGERGIWFLQAPGDGGVIHRALASESTFARIQISGLLAQN